jgi:hypothetical protein
VYWTITDGKPTSRGGCFRACAGAIAATVLPSIRFFGRTGWANRKREEALKQRVPSQIFGANALLRCLYHLPKLVGAGSRGCAKPLDLGRLRQRLPNARDGSIQLREFDPKYMTLTRSLQPTGKRFDDAPAQRQCFRWLVGISCVSPGNPSRSLSGCRSPPPREPEALRCHCSNVVGLTSTKRFAACGQIR